MLLTSKLLALLAAVSAVNAAALPAAEAEPVAEPVPQPIEAELLPRQLGGGPGNTPAGKGYYWSRTWPDSTIKVPKDFDAIPLGNCAYDIVFRRDPKDNKYLLSYFAMWNAGTEVEHTEEKRPINLQYRGAVDSEGYQQYYGRVTDACSTFYDGRPEPERWRVYFTPKPDSKGNGGPGYISPRFY